MVVLQEQSQRPAYDDERVCRDTVTPLNKIVKMIRDNNPDTVIQFYQTWGRPLGDVEDCPTYPDFCHYGTMQDKLTERKGFFYHFFLVYKNAAKDFKES